MHEQSLPAIDNARGNADPRLLRRFLYYGLPIAGIALLILWVSDGFPPRAWRSLWWLLWYWGGIWTLRGSGVLWPLALLLIQSVLLAAAWGVLLWAILGEVMYMRQVRRPRKNVAPQPEEQVQLEQVTPSTPPAARPGKRYAHQRPSTRLRGKIQGGQKFTQVDLPDNPFEGDEHEAVATGHKPAKRQHTDKTQIAPPATDIEAEKAQGEDNPFIFGNPFEGPLPEVFSYDLELQRSIQEIAQEVQRQEQKQSQP